MSLGAVEIDVAVVGGGPGGLATAAAIFSASDGRLRVKVSSVLQLVATQVRHIPMSQGLHCNSRSYVTLCTIGCTLYRNASQVYESLKEYTLQGSVVGLAANAQYALEAIHPDLLSKYMFLLALAMITLSSTAGRSTL